MKKILFWPDTHAPYNDENAVDLALKVTTAFKPDVLVILGDFCDMYSVSSHDKDPRRKMTLGEELAYCRALLKQVKKAAPQSCRRVFLAGNHEWRLERYINKNAPELVDLISDEGLLGLKTDNWEYVPYKKSLKLGEIRVVHDIGKSGPTAHMDAVKVYGKNVVMGHTHAAGIHYSGTLGGDQHVGMTCGWLGSYEDADYMHIDKAMRSWMHGVGIGYQLDDGTVHLSFVPFVNNTAVVEGKVVSL